MLKKPHLDLSSKKNSKCRKAIKRGQEKAATEDCGFLLLSDIVHSYFFCSCCCFCQPSWRYVHINDVSHRINVHIMCFCVRESIKKTFFVNYFFVTFLECSQMLLKRLLSIQCTSNIFLLNLSNVSNGSCLVRYDRIDLLALQMLY